MIQKTATPRGIAKDLSYTLSYLNSEVFKGIEVDGHDITIHSSNTRQTTATKTRKSCVIAARCSLFVGVKSIQCVTLKDSMLSILNYFFSLNEEYITNYEPYWTDS